MLWLPNISFLSPSCSPSKSSSSRKPASYSESPDRDHYRRGQRIYGPRLTRQRKLRHLTDLDVLADQAASSSSSGLALSPSAFAAVLRSPSAAMPLPLPLPLPEGDGDARHHTGKSVGYGKVVEERYRDGDRDRDRDGDRDRDRDGTDGTGDRISCSSSFGSEFASGHHTRKTAKNLDEKSHSAAHQDLGNASSPRDDYHWINIPTRSANTSPYASPVLSPQRKIIGETFPYFGTAAKGNQVWSAPEMPFYLSGFPPPAFLDNSPIHSSAAKGNQVWSAPEMPLDLSGFPPPAFFDNSPIHSPHRQARSPGRPYSPLHPILSAEPSGAPPHESVSSPLHPRLSVDASNAWRGNTNVHPLPLPPGAALPSPSAPVPQVPPKQELFPMNSQWQKGKLIGRGTFGSVYVASNKLTGALCAMKEAEIFPDDPKSSECIKQLEQEIRLLSLLQHQNIVQYYGSETVDDRFYIYLEYVHPGSINKYIREHFGAMTESVVRNFTRHILSGLAYLHSKKTVHRDIKGANLLVDASGVVKLADFGMAKHLTGQRADLSLKGSPYWMAPELMQAVMQKDNSSDLAFAVDIWSLGCTIIEMLNGKPPWSEYEGAAAMFKVMRDTPPIPESLSPEGQDFLRCCFKRNPAARPTASKLLEHRFLKNSPQPSVSSCSQLFNGIKLTEKGHSRGERSSSGFKLDKFPILPGSRSTTRATTSESETGQQQRSHGHGRPLPELAVAALLHSPPEAIPSPSPPRSALTTTTTSRANFGAEENSSR